MKKSKNMVPRKIVLGLIFTLTLISTVIFTSIDASYTSRKYTSQYDSKEEAIIAGAELNERIALEGMVLLKNENTVLPLETGMGTDETKVSVFGYKSVFPDGGGSADGDTSDGIVRLSSDIYSSLSDAGYKVNPVIRDVYEQWSEDSNDNRSDYWFAQDSNYTSMLDTMRNSYQSYDDAAVVVLTATNLEPDSVSGTTPNIDPTTMLDPDGNVVPDLHMRELDQGQLDLVDEVTANFDNVIVVINSSVPLEMEELQNNPLVDSIILAGEPGANGFNALGMLMSGEVNFSGRLADTYMADFTKNPVYNNWARNGELGSPAVEDDPDTEVDESEPAVPAGNQYIDEDGNPRDGWFVDYEEGIYVGYRYYETRGYDQYLIDGDWSWYESEVVYPFGHGLSYTDFNWTVLGSSTPEGTITENTEINVEVEVENTGSTVGKDVVELYYTAPYTDGEIEKAHVILGDFAKTKSLAPGETQVLTLTLKASDMASYDWNDANENGITGYELEAGDYDIKISKNAHDVDTTLTYNVASDVHISNSVTGTEVVNQFDEVNDIVTDEFDAPLSREQVQGESGLSIPTTRPDTARQTITDSEFALWTPTIDEAYDAGQPWEVSEENAPADPALPYDPEDTENTRPETAEIMLSDMIGRSYNDPMWETLIDQLTLDEMTSMINFAGFNTAGIEYIGKPRTHDTDGPRGWSGSGVGGDRAPLFASEVVVASTWNKELAYEFGKMIGEQGLWGNSDLTDGVKTYTGWYAPAMNTHRSIYDWRYTSYYSEDGYLAGMMAANSALGAKEKGAYVYIKHFALHEDGSTDRGIILSGPSAGLSVWANEQAIREVYLKPFQLAVEEGEATAAMSSFSRVGYTWAGGHYGLLTSVLRDEWGFDGMVVTDIAIYEYVNIDQAIRAGGDAVLHAFAHPMFAVSTGEDAMTPTQLSSIRNATKNILYTTANSNAMQNPIGSAVNYTASNIDTATVGNELTVNVADADLNTLWDYSTITYELTSGTLPEGMTFDAATGDITGTPTEDGTYDFIVTATADGYEPAASSYQLVVEPELTEQEILDEKLATLKAEIIAALESDIADSNADIITQIITSLESEIATGNEDTIAEIEAAIDEAINSIPEPTEPLTADEVDQIIKDNLDQDEVEETTGCGSSIGTGTIIIPAIVILGGTALFFIRKKY